MQNEPAESWPAVRARLREASTFVPVAGATDVAGVSVYRGADPASPVRRFAVDNTSWQDQIVTVPAQEQVGPGWLWREVSPRPGRLWDTRVVVARRSATVVEAVAVAALDYPALIGVAGRADDSGSVRSASGRPASTLRVRTITSAGAAPRESIVLFADDGLFESIGAWRDRTGSWANTPLLAGDVELTVEWAPGRELFTALDAAGVPLRLVVDVPAGASVRFWLDDVEVPVSRGFVANRPGDADSDDPELALWSVDLQAARDERHDPTQLWALRVALTDLPLGGFGGVHVPGLPARTTDRFDEITIPEFGWLSGAVDAPTTQEITPGWSVRDLLYANRNRPDPPGAVCEGDVVYRAVDGTAVLGTLVRRADRNEQAPAVVFVHGGGWAGGDRTFHHRHVHQFAAAGYVVLNIEYRLHPDVGWRDSVADVKAAVRWLRSNAGTLGLDPDRIVISGGSAGGHLAGLVATTPGRFEPEVDGSDVSSAVAAAVLYYPAIDLPALAPFLNAPLDEVLDAYFGSELELASPVSHVSADCPPILTLSGSADPLISVASLEHFHAVLDAAGVRNELVIYPGLEHGYDVFGSAWAPSAERMLAFFNEVLNHRAPITKEAISQP